MLKKRLFSWQLEGRQFFELEETVKGKSALLCIRGVIFMDVNINVKAKSGAPNMIDLWLISRLLAPRAGLNSTFLAITCHPLHTEMATLTYSFLHKLYGPRTLQGTIEPTKFSLQLKMEKR